MHGHPSTQFLKFFLCGWRHETFWPWAENPARILFHLIVVYCVHEECIANLRPRKFITNEINDPRQRLINVDLYFYTSVTFVLKELFILYCSA